MRKSKTLIAGIISGLLCAVAVFIYTQGVREEADLARSEALSRYGGEQVEVCVAQRDIAVGEKIDTSNVTTKLWVSDLLPAGTVASLSNIVGKQATSAIYEGEVVLDHRFEESLTQLDIPKDMSAISVPAKDVQAVGGLLAAGMHVDVYAIGTSTELLAEDVLVITTSIDGEGSKAGSEISWVTLALKPETVQETITASQKLELYFVLPSSS